MCPHAIHDFYLLKVGWIDPYPDKKLGGLSTRKCYYSTFFFFFVSLETYCTLGKKNQISMKTQASKWKGKKWLSFVQLHGKLNASQLKVWEYFLVVDLWWGIQSLDTQLTIMSSIYIWPWWEWYSPLD